MPDAESRLGVSGEGAGGWGASVYWDGVSVWEDESILGVGGGGGHTAMSFMPLNCILKNGSNNRFSVMSVLPQFFF